MTETELMLTSILNCRRVDLYVNRPELTAGQRTWLEQIKERRASGEPLQYLLGEAEFCGLTLAVDGRVLIPRPETELLVEAVISAFSDGQKDIPANILDLGTGSGNIVVSLAKHFPGSSITAVDVSAGALNVARKNARVHTADANIAFVRGCMLDILNGAVPLMRKFDVVVSNPPYIPSFQISSLPEDVRREPLLALDGGEDGLKFIRPLIARTAELLAPQGILAVEIGDGQANAVAELFHNSSGWLSGVFIKDYRATERIAVLSKGGTWPIEKCGLLTIQPI